MYEEILRELENLRRQVERMKTVDVPKRSTATDGWISVNETWTYASPTTFTVSGDLTSRFFAGRKIRLVQTGTKYFYVVSSTYSAPNTTVTITGGSDYSLTNVAIADPCYSIMQLPEGFPEWFNYSAAVTSSGGSLTSASVTYAQFAMIGKTKFLRFKVEITTNGTGSGSLQVTLPVVYSSNVAIGVGREYNTGGKMLQVDLAGNLAVIRNYDNTYPGASGYKISVSLTYV